MRYRTAAAAHLFVSTALTPTLLAQEAVTLPIREVTAFKDGHALVMRAGKVPVDARGDLVLTELPRPVLGTFWADTSQPGARLSSVRSERIESQRTKTAGTVEELLRANVGREIAFRTVYSTDKQGTLIDIVEQQAQAIPVAPFGTPHFNSYIPPAQPTQRVALLRSDQGVSAIPIDSMLDVRFLGDGITRELTERADEERMTLDLVWDSGPESEASASLLYLQRGLRWIPSYRVTILDDERVRIELQATLINELADLDDVMLHVAIGVPTFSFEHTPDPMGLREHMDSLGLFFQNASAGQTGAMLSNALMAQSARMSEHAYASSGHLNAGQPSAPELSGAERAEDLFVFSVDHVTLARGARMVVPLTSTETTFESVYTLDLPASPPTQALRNLGSEQHRQIAEILSRPVAQHVLRICNENTEGHPFTTAPALIVREGRALAQGLMTYTPVGASLDLAVGKAVDLGVKTDEIESARVPNAVKWDGHDYMRVDIGFEAQLTNRKSHPVRVEVRKFAFGNPVDATAEGLSEAVSVFSADASWDFGGSPWWQHYNWPYYWHRLNGAARFTWSVELKPGETIGLGATWQYFWN